MVNILLDSGAAVRNYKFEKSKKYRIYKITKYIEITTTLEENINSNFLSR